MFAKLLVALLLVPSLAWSAVATTYTFTETIGFTGFGTGGTYIAGTVKPPMQAALHSAGATTPQGFLPGAGTSRANGVNSLGCTVGYSANGTMRAYLKCPDTAMVDLGALDGLSVGTSVNGAQTIAGYATQGAATVPVLWLGGVIQVLPMLAGGHGSAAAVDENGVAVGWSKTAANLKHAVVWTLEGGMVDIHPADTAGESMAEGIMNGVVAGTLKAPGLNRAFRWSAEDGMELLPLPGGMASCTGKAVDAAGMVLGACNGQVVVWDETNTPIVLSARTTVPQDMTMTTGVGFLSNGGIVVLVNTPQGTTGGLLTPQP